jgi:predicted cupin superfamily sugar epimerase
MNSKEIIKSLNLIAHPEGGYYKENYRSEGLIMSITFGKVQREIEIIQLEFIFF